MKKFEKYCNRSMSLLAVQYWYLGEYCALNKETSGKVRYNPLFIYQKGKGVDIYYDMNNVVEADYESIYDFFKNNPKKFDQIYKKYKKQHKQLIGFAKKSTKKDFEKIFKLHIDSWPGLSIMIAIGDLGNDKKLGNFAKKALKLREAAGDADYISEKNLLRLAGNIFPKIKKYVDVLLYDEIVKKNIPSLEELKQRKRGFIYYREKIYTGISIKRFSKIKNIEIVKSETRKRQIRFISGTIAMCGLAKGTAKIIFENRQLKKIKKGNILIAPMTTPDFLPAMKWAKAFVTDEGGITCHAAITARELKKPCIIGTKIATKVLKDGDLIEVDANKGIVKILKRRGK